MSNLPGCKVLVAEDEPEIRELLVLLLKNAGCAVTAVGNGQDALDAAGGIDFRLAVLDVMMPVMTGLEAAVVMRRSWPTMNIVLQTSMDEDWVRDRFTDYHGYFRKPLDAELFMSQLPGLIQ